MKKLKFSMFALLIVVLVPNYSNSQISFKFGPMVGLTLPTIDYAGETKDFYAGTQYGFRSGLNYGIVAKAGVLSFNGRFSLSYASLSNDGIPQPEKPNSNLHIENNIVLITLGPEFAFSIPKSPIKPYAGIDLLFSSFSGLFKYQGADEVPSDQTDIQSSSRTGLGLAVGSEIKFGNVDFDLSLRYNLHNLFGKSYDSPNSNNRVDAYTNLNDAKDPNYSATDSKHPIGNDRTIATIMFQLGVLFGF